MSLSYEKAGVSIDTADAAKKQMADTMTAGGAGDPRILHRPGAFAALFEASFPGIDKPVLVLKTEEPGSKQKIAFAHGRAASIAFDMINHLINDILVMGAKPVCVQDCIVCGKLQKDVVLQLVKAVNDACRENDCYLLGGETSEQPGVLEAGLYILSSSIVGVVDKSKIIDGSAIRTGDTVLAVPSNGLHTNGYSLVRALMAQHPDLLSETIVSPEGKNESFLDAILRPHQCYYQAFKGILDNSGLHGMAHITGGGVAGNLNRVLPADKDALIDASAIRVLPLFKRIQKLGNVPEADMLKTFNMGVGMTLVCDPAAVSSITAHLKSHNMHAYPIGEITPGTALVKYRGNVNW